MSIQENLRDPSTGPVGDSPAPAASSNDLPPPTQPRALTSGGFGELREIIASAEQAESQRFSLWSLFVLVTTAAVILGVGAYLPKAVFAGVLGIATLVAMVFLSLWRLPAAILQLGWWMLLVIYLIAIVSAVRG